MSFLIFTVVLCTLPPLLVAIYFVFTYLVGFLFKRRNKL